MIKTSLFAYILHPSRLIMPLERRGLLKWLPDKTFIKIAFKTEMDYPLNLKAPKTYSEKIQWTKLYDRKPEYNIYVDKFAVRKYVENTIGSHYLIPIIAVYDEVDEIDWVNLPRQFVLKCTHGSKSNIICDDKDKMDIDSSIVMLKSWMKRNWFWFGREWAYKDIQPRILCEKYLKGNNTLTPDDIKVKCFNGKPIMIDIHHDRFGQHMMNTFDVNWNELDYNANIPQNTASYPKPDNLKEILDLSAALAKNTLISRVDWYLVNGELYFGELTLYEASGYVKKGRYDIDLLLGNMIQLPETGGTR